jgi:hypothetical protein
MIASKKRMTVALAVAALTTVSIVASSDASARGGFGGGRMGGGGFHGGGGFQGGGASRGGFQSMGGRHGPARHTLVTPRPLPPGLKLPDRPGLPPGMGVKPPIGPGKPPGKPPGGPGNPPGAGKPPGHHHGHGHRYFGFGVVGVGYSECLQLTPYGIVNVCQY